MQEPDINAKLVTRRMKGRNFGVSRCDSSELLLGRRLFRGGSVGVDHVREGTLEAERDQIDDVDIERDEEASRALVPVRVGTEVGQRTSLLRHGGLASATTRAKGSARHTHSAEERRGA